METFNLLKEKGYRLTPQRMEVVKIVLDKLEKREHPTFNDIVNEVRARMPSISASTVYNILRLLEENGIVVSFENNGRTYYDKAEPHINVVCIDSDKVIDVEDGELISLFKSKGIRPISIVVKAVCS